MVLVDQVPEIHQALENSTNRHCMASFHTVTEKFVRKITQRVEIIQTNVRQKTRKKRNKNAFETKCQLTWSSITVGVTPKSSSVGTPSRITSLMYSFSTRSRFNSATGCENVNFSFKYTLK